MGNCCPGSGQATRQPSHNSISRNKEQRLANYEATGIVPLRDARLQELPAFVRDLGGKVKTLDVTNNFLSELPPTIQANSNLVRLVLSKNGLTGLPREIGMLSNLKVLNLDENKLSSMPIEICLLEKLETLSIAGNTLESLPEEISQLRRMKTANFSSNRLTKLPAAIGRCSALEELVATDNHLTSIPPELGGLDKLKMCNLDNNRIDAVPSQVLVHCIALHTLSLHNNPITPAALEGTEGFQEFERRRRTKFDKQIASGVLMGSRGLDEGVDRNTRRQ